MFARVGWIANLAPMCLTLPPWTDEPKTLTSPSSSSSSSYSSLSFLSPSSSPPSSSSSSSRYGDLLKSEFQFPAESKACFSKLPRGDFCFRSLFHSFHFHSKVIPLSLSLESQLRFQSNRITPRASFTSSQYLTLVLLYLLLLLLFILYTLLFFKFYLHPLSRPRANCPREFPFRICSQKKFRFRPNMGIPFY